MNAQTSDLLRYLQANGSTASKVLLRHFGISRATLSRRMRELGEKVVTIGKTTSTTYAARDLETADRALYRITESGKATHLGNLNALARGEWFLSTDSKVPTLFQGEFKDGLYPGWPWFLADLRPSGFLGRAFARSLSGVLDYDANPENWTDSQAAHAIAMFGTNLQGSFILGERALDKFLNQDHASIIHTPDQDYPALAQSALNDGSQFGSSAGGEQPKFTTYITNDESDKHVIVKFSPPTDQPAGRRWADLLLAEHIANQTLSECGIPTAKTAIHQINHSVFLESERFDRIGPTGRRGLVSLRALDAAFVGQGSGSWIDCAQKLKRTKLINEEDQETITKLWLFGELIANTDMHFGNLSFYLDDTFPLQLAPCYDMLPMQFRPSPSGEVREMNYTRKHPRPEHETAWHEILPVAQTFWQRISEHPKVSEEFQETARKAHTNRRDDLRVVFNRNKKVRTEADPPN